MEPVFHDLNKWQEYLVRYPQSRNQEQTAIPSISVGIECHFSEVMNLSESPAMEIMADGKAQKES